MKVNAQVVVMNKTKVDQLLEMNINNRPIKRSVVDRYKRDIVSGHWIITNQGIGVSDSGVLIDGQHRLLAIKECGYPPVEMLIVSGLPVESQRVIDQHAKRSARDVFKFVYNASVSRVTPAVLQVIAKFENEKIFSQASTLTIDEMFLMYEQYGSSIDEIASQLTDITFYPAPVLAASVVEHNKGGDVVRILKFLTDIRLGEGLTRVMPEYHLRNFLSGSRISGANSGHTMQSERYYKTKKALIASLNGESMGVLRV